MGPSYSLRPAPAFADPSLTDVSSHLWSLGFPREMDAAYYEDLLSAALSGERFRVGDGLYVRWSPGAGVELWFELREREVVGMAPHFAGGAAMPVALIEHVARPEDSPLSGALRAWANPSGDDPQSGDYPFVFDLPDAGRFAGLALPRVGVVQLAAFAHRLRCFATESDYDAHQEGEALRYAAQSFIPSGLFVEDGGAPTAHAMFTGRVASADLRRNAYSGGTFWHARVATLGGEVDVVADPALVDGEPRVGGVVQGSFWLSGRLPSEMADAQRPAWRRWLQG